MSEFEDVNADTSLQNLQQIETEDNKVTMIKGKRPPVRNFRQKVMFTKQIEKC